jgi:hypothetical protein
MLSVLKGYCVSLFLTAKKGYRSPEKKSIRFSGFFSRLTMKNPVRGRKGYFVEKNRGDVEKKVAKMGAI